MSSTAAAGRPETLLVAQLHDLRDNPWLMLISALALVGGTWLMVRRRSVLSGCLFVVVSFFWLAVNGAVEDRRCCM